MNTETPEGNMGSVLGIDNLKDLKKETEVYLSNVLELQKHRKEHLVSISVIQEAVIGDKELKLEYGEYIGYMYGSIDASLNTVDACVSNLENVTKGEHDKLDVTSLAMFVSIWNAIAIVELDTVDVGILDLETMEQELFDGDAKSQVWFNNMDSETIH